MDTAEFTKSFPKLSKQLGKQGTSSLLSLVATEEVSAGQPVIHGDSPSDAIYLVLTGEFLSEVIRDDGTIEVEHFGPGRWIGTVELFLKEARPVIQVIATEPSSVLCLNNSDFWSTMQENSVLAAGLMHIMVNQMSESAREIDDMILSRLETA